ncbi:MAG: hypothetical protein IKM43_02945 [Clostridia bacterium]|nr:hypothetical protein [Clostridia bacterium]
MIVETAKPKVKCDASGCNNACNYQIVNKKFVFDGSVYLCEKCLNELYGEIGRYIKPKNIKPIYKKGGKDE